MSGPDPTPAEEAREIVARCGRGPEGKWLSAPALEWEIAAALTRHAAAARAQGRQEIVFALRELPLSCIAEKHSLHLLGVKDGDEYVIPWESFRNVWETLSRHAEEVAPEAAKAQRLYEGGAEDMAEAAARREREVWLADVRFLLSFVPPWAEDVPEGLCPTMYGTNTAEGDREVKARVDEIKARAGGGCA